MLFSTGSVQCARVPGEEPGHAPSRHRGGAEDLREQASAAALLQSAHQDRWDLNPEPHPKTP